MADQPDPELKEYILERLSRAEDPNASSWTCVTGPG